MLLMLKIEKKVLKSGKNDMIYNEDYYAFKLTPQYEYKHTKFLSTDSAKEYSINVRKLGKDWEWFGVDIDYNFNSYGYRTKELIGLNEKDVYINQLGKHFNLDVFNLAHGGQGIDYCFYNTINYLNKLTKLPKFVVYQWPFETRKSFMYAEKVSEFNLGIDYLHPYYDENNPNRSELLNMDDEWYSNRFLADEGEMLKQMVYYIDACNLLWKNLKVPVLNFHWPSVPIEQTMYNGFMLNKTYPFFQYRIDIDRARDIVHAGKKSHLHLTSCILKDLNKHNIYPIERLL